jgi:transglutaminase-like putative cysteine protease
MRYRVTHTTKYEYSSPVSLSHNQNRLRPRSLEYQTVVEPSVAISPEPRTRQRWIDSFGNETEFFSIEQSHREMTVCATSEVARTTPRTVGLGQVAWEEIVRNVTSPLNPETRRASQFVFDSRYAKKSQQAYDYAVKSFVPGRSVMGCAIDLTRRIFQEFEYDPQATQVSTPTLAVLEGRRGVCQDFAHVQIACMRSMGIPCRYVSGYLLTHAPEGKTKLVGSDASHAWVSVYMGQGNWVDFDPTNNLIPTVEHITIGWGRDYGDVCPVQGVLIGGGATILTVSVDVRPLEPIAAPIGNSTIQNSTQRDANSQMQINQESSRELPKN